MTDVKAGLVRGVARALSWVLPKQLRPVAKLLAVKPPPTPRGAARGAP
jgi:hypothetical protein